MKKKLFIFSFISLFYILKCLPSKDIWNQVINGTSNYSLINNTNYFIFQENDYCKRDIYSEDMIKLYEKQKSFFSKRNTANYIFVVENFDEKLESIEDGAYHLSQYLYNEFKVKMENSVLALFSIKTRRIRIRTGEITKKNLTDSEAGSIISSMGDLLRQNNYYEAFLKYYDNLDYYMDTESSDYLVVIIMVAIFGFIFISIIVNISIEECKKCYYLPDDSTLKNIVSFLKSQKTNKKIFTENCIICLNNLSKTTKKNSEEKKGMEIIVERYDTEKNDIEKKLVEKEEEVNEELVEKQENGISTLKCGHQFHTECIVKWLKLKNNCPICRQVILNETDNNKIVWRTQIELHPTFYNINYDHLYTRDFYVTPPPSSDNYNYSSNYSYGGGCDCGGGATGGW